MKIFTWTLRLSVALILLQTLYFKFTAQPESVYIFSTVNMEPWGRWISGCVEMIASILLLLNSKAGLGAFISFSTMSGALFFHLTTLGIEVQGDGGLLFSMALYCWLASVFLIWTYRKQIPIINNI